MLLANQNGELVRPEETGQRASCPTCENEVIAKCGDVRIDHWAHANTVSKCNLRDETVWHRMHKKRLLDAGHDIDQPKSMDGEARVIDGRVDDVLGVEFVRTPPQPEEIRLMEDMHGPMVWVLQREHSYDKFQFGRSWDDGTELPSDDEHFYWKRGPKRLLEVGQHLYLDFAEKKGELWEVEMDVIEDVRTSFTDGAGNRRVETNDKVIAELVRQVPAEEFIDQLEEHAAFVNFAQEKL